MTASGKRSAVKLRVQQVRSGIGFEERQKATLRALGLGKVGRTRELADNPEVRAMIGKISHLVRIVGEGQG
jgi:large subunit ribosomal protein L30